MRRPALLPVRPAGWWFDALLVAAFVALTVALARGALLGLDSAVAAWADAHRPTPLYWVARVLNYLGQGGQVLMPVALLLAGLLARRTRSARPVLVFAAAFLLTYVTVGPLKMFFDRAAPHSSLPDRVELLNDLPPGEFDLSYPSGHVANALVWYAAIAILVAALLRAYGRPPLSHATYLALRAAPPLIVLATTTYLSFHWVSDSVAGLLIGLPLARLLARVPFDDLPLPRRLGDWAAPAGLTPPTR